MAFQDETEQYQGGYDYEFSEGPVPDEYLCLICTMVAREAHQINCCGKLVCSGCLEALKDVGNNKCPTCRKNLQGRHFLDRMAVRTINHFKVYCNNSKSGCTWRGEIQAAEKHHNTCSHRIIPCPNKCSERIQKKDLTNHLRAQCPNRIAMCTHCGESGAYAYISSSHLESCPDLRIECPNKDCQEKLKRRDMAAHKQKCPKEMVSCEYAHLGCMCVCLREDMFQHSKQQVDAHLQLVTKDARIARQRLRADLTMLAMPRRRQGTQFRHVIKMTPYSDFKDSERQFYSTPFLTSPDGYELCLNVDAAGTLGGENAHVSTFLFLMEGPNDNILEWPMRGKFSIELLNQEKDEDHKLGTISLAEKEGTGYNSRVKHGRAPEGFGRPKFMSHKDLEGDSLPPITKYLKEDTLYFRVTMTEMESSSKAWLAGALS